jgi:hypothetical protein
VDQESPTRFEPNNQILAATAHRRDPFALELTSHVVGIERTCQPRVEDPYTRQLPPLEHGRETQSDGLDFGKLRHAATVALRVGMTERAIDTFRSAC